MRVRDYQPRLLDELTASGEVLWQGHGSLAGTDGWISLHTAKLAPFTLAAAGAAPNDLRIGTGDDRRWRLLLPSARRPALPCPTTN